MDRKENNKKNPVQGKSFAFAVRIVRLYQHLVKEHKIHYSKQGVATPCPSKTKSE